MIVLDTNVLIDLDRYVLDPDEVYGASIVSRAELELGVHAARTAQDVAARTRRLNELDQIFDWLPLDVGSTRSYGIVAAGARVTGARVRGRTRSSRARRTGTARR